MTHAQPGILEAVPAAARHVSFSLASQMRPAALQGGLVSFLAGHLDLRQPGL